MAVLTSNEYQVNFRCTIHISFTFYTLHQDSWVFWHPEGCIFDQVISFKYPQYQAPSDTLSFKLVRCSENELFVLNVYLIFLLNSTTKRILPMIRSSDHTKSWNGKYTSFMNVITLPIQRETVCLKSKSLILTDVKHLLRTLKLLNYQVLPESLGRIWNV